MRLQLTACLLLLLQPLSCLCLDLCPWLAKVPLAEDAAAATAACVEQCFEPCREYEGEYLCSGYKIYEDDDNERLDMSSPTKHAYCYCQRTVLRRAKGSLCGPNMANCGMTEEDITAVVEPPPIGSKWVIGINTNLEGFQGDLSAEIYDKIDAGVPNDESILPECDPLLFQQRRTRFNKKGTGQN